APEYAASHYVGLLSENRPEWPIAYLAILAAGKTVVPIDANYKSTEIAYIVSDAKLDVIFLSGRFEQTIRDLFPAVRQFSFEPDSTKSWRQLQREPLLTFASPACDLAVLIYTSGTTGAPKTVQLTHRNLLCNLSDVELALEFGTQDVFLSVLPLHHTFEATCGFLTPLMSGCTVVYARSLKSKEILEDLALNSVSIMCGVPLLYEKMHATIMRRIQEAPLHRRLLFKTIYFVSSLGWKVGQMRWGRTLFRSLRKRAGLHTLRMLVSGGAPLPPSIARFFNLIGIDFLQGYGMTEASPVISVNRPDNIQFGSVGSPIGKLEVRIDQPDESGVGEILVRGDSVTPGYLRNPELSAELLASGWLHTGDLGRFRNGHLWITGRRKNLIISAAGKNIYPEELEEKLLGSPYVTEALVFGRKKDAKQGEEVRAMIFPDLEQFKLEYGIDPAHPDLAKVNDVLGEVVRQINQHVADYKRIAGFEVTLQEFEKTSTKKIKRFIYSQPAKG
ncbi:MAG: AMP-binding protein, partial [candidate division Zixibacteria bacterium]|nr:AMP-binding protein [candidate division Zixibacteria bacterium]